MLTWRFIRGGREPGPRLIIFSMESDETGFGRSVAVAHSECASMLTAVLPRPLSHNKTPPTESTQTTSPRPQDPIIISQPATSETSLPPNSSFSARGPISKRDSHLRGPPAMQEPPGDAYVSNSTPLPDGHKAQQSAADGTTAVYASQGDKLHLHRPLTLFRRVRGFACLACLVLTSFVSLTFLAPVAFYLPRFFSVHYGRLWTSFFIGNWLSLWPYLFEEVNETKVIFAGEKVPRENRVMIMCNHRTEVDWMYIWNLAIRRGKIGFCKYAVKSSVKNLPLFGWAFYCFEFLMLDRRWEVDAPVIKTYLDSFQDKRDPLWFIVFPEGTDFTEAKRDKGNAYARENGYPELVNVLQPRTRGFVTCLSQLRGSLDAVYDLTIGYKKQCPLFINNLYGTDPSEVHIHVRRIPIPEIPESEDDMSKWLYNIFLEKDQILATFSKTGAFPNSGIEESPLDIPKGVFNLALHIVVSLWLYWCLYKSMWLKLYAALVCLALALGTYFDWRPTPFYSGLGTNKKML